MKSPNFFAITVIFKEDDVGFLSLVNIFVLNWLSFN